jgi:hypothetical protein
MWAVWIWRQDSQLLARMRPIIEEFLRLTADEDCNSLSWGADQRCIDDPELPAGSWCAHCNYQRLSNQLKGLP